MTQERSFGPSDRYVYDFGKCTTAKGWAQIDTSQDASYFGQWINPTRLEIFCYCEGDLILTRCESAEELHQQVVRMKVWNEENGHRFKGIDPGFNEALKTALCEAGLAEFLH